MKIFVYMSNYPEFISQYREKKKKIQYFYTNTEIGGKKKNTFVYCIFQLPAK